MQATLPNLLAVSAPSKRVDGASRTTPTNKRQEVEPLSPLVATSTNGSDDHNAVVDYTLASLDMMHSDLAKTIVLAVQLQLQGLTTALKQLGEEDGRVTMSSQEAQQVTNEAFAAAIKASLDTKFDCLDKEASDLTRQIPYEYSATEANRVSNASSPQIAASLADELLPEITGDVAAKIDNIISARVNDLKRSENADKSYSSTSKYEVEAENRSDANISKGSNNARVQFDSRIQSKDSHSTTHQDGGSRSQLRGETISLPVGAIRQASSSSLVGMTTRHSDIMRNKQPERAFVVNFRRLVEIQKVLSLIHLIIKSTAIATLTLVSCGFWTDFIASVLFVGGVLGIYAVHEIRFDGMDIEDYKALSGLMEDDNGTCRGTNGESIEVQNPNRLLKALSLSKNLQRRRRSGITVICLTLFVLVMWVGVVCAWVFSDIKNDLWLGFLHEDEIAVMATQHLIGTVMVLFHSIFEWLYWRETQCVMPWNDEQHRPWDPRTKRGDGVPPQYLWFGLPSMWFTSREAYDDLRLWITIGTSSKPVSHVETKIFPEEMALYALDPDNACDLRRTLKHAKLFSLADWEYQVREEDPSVSSEQSPPRENRIRLRSLQVGQSPDELQVELALYDSATGQFLEPHHHKEYRTGLVQLLANRPVPPHGRGFLHADTCWLSSTGSEASL